ncbi:tRNA-dihydrouridine(16/17) synthase [NAD(P)(+)] [Wickerhamiella sorbophila]|uniref:tRNA-dihydrouridine(16/17) synthase [NAD(P)(+)] n=1 Tax=Wickerhamiella sorbophila TaxID=45607 RepID=A0A2T0FLP6_9ASCO|nr:tRNA-dihydrouridine(16/17) synthase [NAD(P)(+)] [Wickerhamiella sorbophila]PRT55902.1 tRNA-dihydrouridine(16/17) synthase [NAD(P)(+)] [Wickerhamiella sorbophila]
MSSKLQGRELYESLGSPKKIVAPMVDQSELAWRILSRRHGADLCYSPMYNARLFGTNETYRRDNFGELDGDEKIDRPLVVQFCANNPDELLAAAKHVVGRCDAVDLNLGCPQGIARKGHYGAFLMEEWDLIHSMISKLHQELDVPVTAKIRIFPEKEKTLEYAKMVLSAGAQFLTVHGRTREMKGQQTGLADWSYIKYLRDNLPPNTVIFANGNIVYQHDIPRCLEVTGADAVMSAETNLVNPAVFSTNSTIDNEYPRVDKLLREYFEIAKETPGRASAAAMKSHFFKILRSFLPHAIDIRNQIGPIKRGEYEKYEDIVRQVEERVAKVLSEEGVEDKVTNDGEYKNVPYWRCQPLFRVVDGMASNGKITGKRKATDQASEVSQSEKMAKVEAQDTIPATA